MHPRILIASSRSPQLVFNTATATATCQGPIRQPQASRCALRPDFYGDHAGQLHQPRRVVKVAYGLMQHSGEVAWYKL